MCSKGEVEAMNPTVYQLIVDGPWCVGKKEFPTRVEAIEYAVRQSCLKQERSSRGPKMDLVSIGFPVRLIERGKELRIDVVNAKGKKPDYISGPAGWAGPSHWKN